MKNAGTARCQGLNRARCAGATAGALRPSTCSAARRAVSRTPSVTADDVTVAPVMASTPRPSDKGSEYRFPRNCAANSGA